MRSRRHVRESDRGGLGEDGRLGDRQRDRLERGERVPRHRTRVDARGDCARGERRAVPRRPREPRLLRHALPRARARRHRHSPRAPRGPDPRPARRARRLGARTLRVRRALRQPLALLSRHVRARDLLCDSLLSSTACCSWLGSTRLDVRLIIDNYDLTIYSTTIVDIQHKLVNLYSYIS